VTLVRPLAVARTCGGEVKSVSCCVSVRAGLGGRAVVLVVWRAVVPCGRLIERENACDLRVLGEQPGRFALRCFARKFRACFKGMSATCQRFCVDTTGRESSAWHNARGPGVPLGRSHVVIELLPWPIGAMPRCRGPRFIRGRAGLKDFANHLDRSNVSLLPLLWWPAYPFGPVARGAVAMTRVLVGAASDVRC
jgi:hypothetical protein